MSERIININGVYYVSRTNEHGVYLVRVNADGSQWVDSKPLLTDAERASGITQRASYAPAEVKVADAPKRPWWRRIFGF